MRENFFSQKPKSRSPKALAVYFKEPFPPNLQTIQFENSFGSSKIETYFQNKESENYSKNKPSVETLLPSRKNLH